MPLVTILTHDLEETVLTANQYNVVIVKYLRRWKCSTCEWILRMYSLRMRSTLIKNKAEFSIKKTQH